MSKLKNVYFTTLVALTTLVGCDNPEKNKSLTGENISTVQHENGDHDINKVSQALGNFIGRNLNSPGIHFDLESIIKGIRDGASGKESPMTDQEYETAMAQLQQQAITAISAKNLEAANAFMKENVHAKDIKEIIPGKLQYLILQEGKDPVVVEHGTPQIVYTGKYIDGTIFGSSDAAGGPITIPLDQTIPGFSQGIVGMKEGEKRRLFVHPEVGYGTSGQLLPNSLLIFDIEVIKSSIPLKDGSQTFHADDELTSDQDSFDEKESNSQKN